MGIGRVYAELMVVTVSVADGCPIEEVNFQYVFDTLKVTLDLQCYANVSVLSYACHGFMTLNYLNDVKPESNRTLLSLYISFIIYLGNWWFLGIKYSIH